MRFWLDLAAVEALGRHGRCVRLAAAAPNQPDLSGSAFGLEAEPRVFRSPDIQKEMQSGLHKNTGIPLKAPQKCQKDNIPFIIIHS